MDTFERVVANYQQSGYKNTGQLQGRLVFSGNQAAHAYPNLDRIKRCTTDSAEVVESSRDAEHSHGRRRRLRNANGGRNRSFR